MHIHKPVILKPASGAEFKRPGNGLRHKAPLSERAILTAMNQQDRRLLSNSNVGRSGRLRGQPPGQNRCWFYRSESRTIGYEPKGVCPPDETDAAASTSYEPSNPVDKVLSESSVA